MAVFRDELRNLFPSDLDAQRLSQQAFTLGEFLAKHDYRPPPLDRRAVVHGHCHQKSIIRMEGEEKILQRMGLDYGQILDSGCCGMAGSFGFEEGNYDISMKIGSQQLFPAVAAAEGDTLIIADGFSCRHQIAEGTNRQAMHLAQVLKMALDSGPRGPTGAFPEVRYPTARLDGPERWKQTLRTAAIGGLCLGGAAVAVLRREKCSVAGGAAKGIVGRASLPKETITMFSITTRHISRSNVANWQQEHPWEPSPKSFPQPVPLVCQSDLINPMLRAGDIAAKGVRVCDQRLPVVEAVRLLAECESGLLAVVEGGKPVGVLTERDVVRALAKGLMEFSRSPVGSVMSKEWAQVRDDATLDKLLACFGSRGTLVVDRHGGLIGIIYWRCLASHFSERGLGRALAKLFERSLK
ncbi:MAG TPA: CBS domain-containing protein [Pirellulales bacterium]|nr:CBS domain-containing protein [Pirellulales bacterium]